MTILFINAYSAKNRGDYAIVLSMHDYMKKLFPNSEIEIMSSYHEENKKIYKEHSLVSTDNIWNIKDKTFLQKYKEGFKLLLTTIVDKKSTKFKKIRNADLVCSVGGGYLYSSTKGPLGIGFLNMLFHIWLSKRYNKKLICFPQSVGPIKFKLDKYILKYVLEKVDLFISREPITTNYLINEVKLNNIVEYPDIAFLLKGSESYPIEIKQNEINIGVTVLNWLFSDSNSNDYDIVEYINKLKETFIILKQKMNIKIHIFVQVDVSNGDSDYEISNRLYNLLIDNNIKTNLVRFPEEINPKKLISTYGNMNLFIGSRMHSTIFALDANIPTISLAYQPKTTGTFERLNLDDFCLNIKDFSVKELLSVINKIFENKYNIDILKKIIDENTLDSHIKEVIQK